MRPRPVPESGLALDQAGVGEAAKLGIDLAVARGPEEAGRLVDELLDVIAAHRPEAEHPEDHVGGGVELHLSARYIGSDEAPSVNPVT